MIQEDYCSEELVKLLLEKGCSLDKVIKQDGRPFIYTLPKDDPNWRDCDAYYIPTLAQAMKWLRKKDIYLNIRIALNRMEDDVINNIHWVVDILDFSSQEWKDNDIWADTYEEAVEAALKYCLTKLI